MERSRVLSVMVPLFLGLGLPAMASGPSSPEAAPRHHSGVLEPGWNLLVAPFDVPTLPTAWREAAVSVWRVDEVRDAGQFDGGRGGQPVASLVAGAGYWVHTDAALPFTWLGEGDATPAAVNGGWQLVFAPSPPVVAYTPFDRLLAWDAPKEGYVPLESTAVLRPGYGYFGHGVKTALFWDDTMSDAGLGPRMGSTGDGLSRFESMADRNYEEALRVKAGLFRFGGENGEAPDIAYQVEYGTAERDLAKDGQGSRWLVSHFAEGRAYDSQYLAAFERVWAYTQGIALAQWSRRDTLVDRERAQGLARYLCDRAEEGTHEGAEIIKGWPFSWNTLGDDWKDARLVTGASAWVVHGLGVFATSLAFEDASDADQVFFRDCYTRALRGLEVHRRSGVTEDGRTVSLMTAGFTARGLDQAATPWNIEGPQGQRLALQGEAWDYADVLDALGYDHFDPANPPQVGRRFEKGDAATAPEEEAPKTLTEGEFRILKEEVRAQNVVTEHNLDVLSVLNHALNHADELELSRDHLEKWRSALRDGIFYVLWDEDNTRWRQDLNDALTRAAVTSQKRADIEGALTKNEWGRVSTGGLMVSAQDLRELGKGHRISRDAVLLKLEAGAVRADVRLESTAGTFHFVRSPHVAIDNCSWLALSVDYDDLPGPDHIDRLEDAVSSSPPSPSQNT